MCILPSFGSNDLEEAKRPKLTKKVKVDSVKLVVSEQTLMENSI